MKDSNESRNSFASGRTFNFLNSSLPLTPAIIAMIFFWMINTCNKIFDLRGRRLPTVVFLY
jgi:hypothetical protein